MTRRGPAGALARACTVLKVILGETHAKRRVLERTMPSLSNSPWICGAPQRQFSAAMRRIRSRQGKWIRGLPGRRERRRQHRRKPSRCHRSTVAGWTSTSASLHPGHNQRNNSQNSRSDRRKRRFERARTLSWWRSASVSSRRSRRVAGADRAAALVLKTSRIARRVPSGDANVNNFCPDAILASHRPREAGDVQRSWLHAHLREEEQQRTLHGVSAHDAQTVAREVARRENGVAATHAPAHPRTRRVVAQRRWRARPLLRRADEHRRAAHLSAPSRTTLAAHASAARSAPSSDLCADAAAHRSLIAAGARLSSLPSLPPWRHSLRWEPDAGDPHVRICGGGAQ